jgi:translation initiation factor IF-2
MACSRASTSATHGAAPPLAPAPAPRASRTARQDGRGAGRSAAGAWRAARGRAARGGALPNERITMDRLPGAIAAAPAPPALLDVTTRRPARVWGAAPCGRRADSARCGAERAEGCSAGGGGVFARVGAGCAGPLRRALQPMQPGARALRSRGRGARLCCQVSSTLHASELHFSAARGSQARAQSAGPGRASARKGRQVSSGGRGGRRARGPHGQPGGRGGTAQRGGGYRPSGGLQGLATPGWGERPGGGRGLQVGPAFVCVAGREGVHAAPAGGGGRGGGAAGGLIQRNRGGRAGSGFFGGGCSLGRGARSGGAAARRGWVLGPGGGPRPRRACAERRRLLGKGGGGGFGPRAGGAHLAPRRAAGRRVGTTECAKRVVRGW